MTVLFAWSLNVLSARRASAHGYPIGHTEDYVGGMLGDEIWFMDDRDTFNTGNISRGSLSHNPIITYDYSNGKKTGGYW